MYYNKIDLFRVCIGGQKMNENEFKEFMSIIKALGLETLGDVEIFAKSHGCFGRGQNEKLLEELRKELASKGKK